MNKKLEKSLMPNEKVIKTVEYTNLFYAPGIAFAVLGVLSCFSAEYFFQGVLVAITAIIMGLLFCIPWKLYSITNVLAVTNKKIYGRTGLIKTDELESPINKIQNIKVQHSILGRILKYGTIFITTDSGVYGFKYINKPEDFRKAVMSQIEASEYDKMDVHANKIASAISKNK